MNGSDVKATLQVVLALVILIYLRSGIETGELQKKE